MFGTTLTIAVTIMQVYIFWRACSVPFLVNRISRKAIIGIGVALWILFYVGRTFENDLTGVLAYSLEMFSMTWLASLFLISITFLCVDIITGFGFLMRRYAPLLRGLALVIGVILSITALTQGMRPPVVNSYDVSLTGLPAELDGTVMIALSDFHLGSLIGKDWLDARVTQVLDQEPDIIVLLGDMFEGHGGSPEDLLPSFSCLSAPLGVWAVLGNHDRFGRSNSSVEMMEQAGITLLRNTWSEIAPGLVLAGVDNLRDRYGSDDGDNPVSDALNGRPPGAAVFLSHQPRQADVAEEAGAGLMLSAHTHGGQVWPFGYIVRQEYPMLAGRYEVGSMSVIVSRGTGTWGPRMRLWHPGEILRVTLHSDVR
ncbi:metallophosphoesterase [candidate division KSB1 bacterium]